MQPLSTPGPTPTRAGPGSLLLCLALALLGSAAVVLPRSLAVEVALPAKACVALLGASIGLALCAQRSRRSDLLPGLRGWILVGLVGLSALRMNGVADPILARERLAGLLALAGSYLLVRRVLSAGAREEQRLESLVRSLMSLIVLENLGVGEFGPGPCAGECIDRGVQASNQADAAGCTAKKERICDEP